VGVINVLATLGALALIDRVGRKPLLYTGLAGMAVSLSAIAVSSMLSSGGTITAADLVTVVAVWAFVAFFAISLGPIPWLMASELFPVGVRGKAASIATVVGWLGNLFISFTFLGLLDLIGESATFFSYAAVAVLGLVFVWFLVPETKGRTLEEIEEGFISRAKARLKD
jgi:MFS family permease